MNRLAGFPSGVADMAGVAERVLIVGLDGGTYDVLAPLAAAGVMPHLARFMSRAALAELTSTEPAITPVAWTTLQTGCDPCQHGILDYRYLDHKTGLLRLNHAGRVRQPTLFDAVTVAGGQVVSLGLPMTYPPHSTWRGIVVGGIDSPSPAAALQGAPHLAQAFARHGLRYDLSLVWKRRPRTTAELAAGIAHTENQFRVQAAAARLADAICDWQLMFVQFQTLDALQHRLWDLLGIETTSSAPGDWIAICRHALATLDTCLGELFELAEKRGAAVALASDHGFGPFRGQINVPEILRRDGLLVPAGVRARLGYRLSRIAWKLHRAQWRRSRAGAKTAALSRPLEALLPIDWRRTRALTLHGSLGALVYLNTPGRFERGSVDGGRAQDQALVDAAGALTEARHPVTQERLFAAVYRVTERFGLDPLDFAWPEVIGIAAPGFHTRSKLDGPAECVLPDADMAATHRREGVLMIGPPAVPLGARTEVHLRDVAPTLLHLLGIPRPPSMTGGVAEQLFRPAPVLRPVR